MFSELKSLPKQLTDNVYHAVDIDQYTEKYHYSDQNHQEEYHSLRPTVEQPAFIPENPETDENPCQKRQFSVRRHVVSLLDIHSGVDCNLLYNIKLTRNAQSEKHRHNHQVACITPYSITQSISRFTICAAIPGYRLPDHARSIPRHRLV